MPAEKMRRQRRHPLSPEEVAEILALKKRQAHFKLHKFKRTRFYKALNIFNVLSFCIYLEILFCFAGPCRYKSHVAADVQPHYGDSFNAVGETIVHDLEVRDERNRKYVFVVKDFVAVPVPPIEFFVGEDYLLGKELKGFFDDSENSYRIFAASPVLFLSVLVMTACFIAFVYNLNQNAYSLSAVSVLNVLTVFAIMCY